MTRLAAMILIAASSLPLLAGCGTASGIAPIARRPAATAPKATPAKPTVQTSSAQGRAFITQVGAEAPLFTPKGDQLIFASSQGLMAAQPNGQAARTLNGTRAGDGAPAISPDGATIVFVRPNGDRGSALMRLAGATGQASAVLETPEMVTAVTWTPDGRSLVYVAGAAGKASLYRLSVPGNTPVKLWEGAGAGTPTVTGNGRVVLDVQDDAGNWSLVQVSLSGGSPTRLDVAGTHPRYPRLSPSGNSLAYVADDGLYVGQATGAGAKRVAGGSGLKHPSWNPQAAQMVVAAPRGARMDLQVVALPAR